MKTYLTTDEFVEAYTEGLKAFLGTSFSRNKDDKHHLEDLMASVSTYGDAVFQFVSSIPTKPRCKCERTNV